MHAQTVEATDWWAKSRGQTTANWIANYQKSLASRHRTVLVEVLTKLGAQTVLEVGCHCGPNLIRLAEALPTASLHGIDANADAVQAGRTWVADRNLASRVQLHVGRFPDATAAIASGTYDVVLTCYALAYIAPADLDAALYECGRLATNRSAQRASDAARSASWPGVPSTRRISLGTDAHHPEQLEFMELSLAAAWLAKIPADRILNFMPVDSLKHWAQSVRGR